MRVYLEDQAVELPEKSSIEDLCQKLSFTKPNQAVAFSLNQKLVDATEMLSEGDVLSIWDFSSSPGKEVFWHTSAHVLAQAVLRHYPEAHPTIGPPIENGFYYDFANLSLTDEDLAKIEKECRKIVKENAKPVKTTFPDKATAKAAFSKNPYKQELIDGFPDNTPITAYQQQEFFDLCRGPHVPSLGKMKGFKLLKLSGAYWRGDANNEMLTRIYGISFPSREELQEYLFRIEEAKKRDHRVLGTKLHLFSFREEAPGMPFIHPKGMVIWNALLSYWQEVHEQRGYQIIKTPMLMSQDLWKQSGHWEHYRENMFTSSSRDDREFAIKPMNCPGCMLYYKHTTHSYRELPLRIAEFGHVHRREPSGALNGLFRVQSFHQDDAHLFMKKSQIKEEILQLLDLVQTIYHAFGLHYSLELSTRPEKSIGTDQDWNVSTNSLQEALEEWNKPFRRNEGDGAFYGPKIDLHVQDALGRSWQCGTIQLDFSLPEKFALTYKESTGELLRPIMVHRAIFGSFERFLAILVEHFAGKFPLWLSPYAVQILPVASTHARYAEKLQKMLREKEIHSWIDSPEESLGKRVRKGQLLHANYTVTVGDEEQANDTLSIRTRDNFVHKQIPLKEFLAKLEQEKRKRQLSSSYQKPVD